MPRDGAADAAIRAPSAGHTDASDAAAAKAAGMDVYLRKPATPAEINDALRTIRAVRRV